jgi:hypothetical protein
MMIETDEHIPDLVVSDGSAGVEAAETGESDALARNKEGCARDGTVGVAQYVTDTLQG